ncbi:uncharacterized protein PFL1_03874 [Pseudozyma flocculosa PF-1]|uniref:Related to ZRT2 - Zinc transporter II n=2 Tax=Pseudozyma flocculosa TaxID=84751 RepID=A0A5C3EWB6_9BASI|nr:uncharacterized protein PFL1_03874 [Pseudozyma flocculosa PF-1]EPQ28570.1 hypothetical protein PFL1_03874 [Pseudozyma flocculosa PF-1]SPO36508.1 related to ZRT2 - Zinc transporter II [Pseudozyma flocculosa]
MRTSFLCPSLPLLASLLLAASASGSVSADIVPRQAPTPTTAPGPTLTSAIPPAPTGRGECTLHGDHWDCAGDATVGHDEEDHHAEHEDEHEGHAGHVDEEGHDHDHEAEAEAESSSIEGEDSHAGHSDDHAGHAHGPSAQYGCGLAPLQNYDLGLHVAAIFILLASSSTGTFLPILLQRRTSKSSPEAAAAAAAGGSGDVDGLQAEGFLSKLFFVCRHFGTGIILSTAFIHLLSHAVLYFANECVGELEFESTAPAIAMASIWLVFVVDFFLLKSVRARALAASSSSSSSDVFEDGGMTRTSSLDVDESKGGDGGRGAGAALAATSPAAAESQARGDAAAAKVQRVDLWMLEAGIIFHSILIGVTLGAATGSGWIALLIAITFHQLFEGIALGSRIALLPRSSTSLPTKMIMAAAYALTTPTGIAIGLGVRRHFNSNSKPTLIAMGTLHAISAGILIYTALVELISVDFIHNRRMLNSSNARSISAVLAVTAGAAAMSVLGKWA